MNASEKGRWIKPRVFDSEYLYAYSSDKTLSGVQLWRRSAELFCHFARGNSSAAQRPLTCSPISISSWFESTVLQMSPTYWPYFQGATARTSTIYYRSEMKCSLLPVCVDPEYFLERPIVFMYPKLLKHPCNIWHHDKFVLSWSE